METHFWTRRRRFAKNIFSEALDSRTTSDERERERDIVQQVFADVIFSACPNLITLEDEYSWTQMCISILLIDIKHSNCCNP